ncbi:MAG: hydrogenase expression/formation protein HypE [Sedimentisphaerales bacterium]|nr:hydrogenase expression/formation protein HypE [Sedimentisphaerales bacterium]
MSREKADKILLAHGGGGRLMQSLLREIILPKFNTDVKELNDSAKLDLESNKICFTTDSYVVKPLFFNGGDIGKLAVCGTINDLAVAGAKPVALSLSLIIETGFEIEQLEKIIAGAAAEAEKANVKIVTGDTKTVEAGAAEGLYINTAGIGVRIFNTELGFDKIQTGDKIIISGTIGDHGMTIMSQREGIGFETPLASDCAALSPLTEQILENCDGVKFMRDPTRGGLAATLNEIASTTGLNIEINEADIPINPTVQAAADMLGFDVLNIANEGKVVIVVSRGQADKCLRICKSNLLGKDANMVGRICAEDEQAIVEMKTKIGGRRVVQMPYGRNLPRIC